MITVSRYRRHSARGGGNVADGSNKERAASCKSSRGNIEDGFGFHRTVADAVLQRHTVHELHDDESLAFFLKQVEILG
jgi:hypothetical protein